MKNIFLIFVLGLLISCHKKEDDPKPAPYVAKYKTLRIELIANKSTAPSNYISSLKIYINGVTSVQQTYTSPSDKSNSIIHEYQNVQDNKQLSITGQSSICDVPMTINVYYDGSLINSVSSSSTCTNDLSAGYRFPNFGK